MSLELCILASGSGGNCSVLRTPAGVVLIDIGVGPRAIVSRLAGTGVSVEDVRAICLTHLDADHFKPSWLKAIADRGITLHCHASRDNDVRRHDRQRRVCTPTFARWLRSFASDSFEPLPGLSFTPIALSHDEEGSHGFVIDGFGSRIGYATDLGQVPDELIERFCDLDVLAIECNYDPHLQQMSGRPWFLQQRITGGRGHLSNEQCFEAVTRILDRCEADGTPLPRHVVLLHRSRQCNCPSLVRDLFHQDERLVGRLTLAEQSERTEWLSAGTLVCV